MRSLYVLGSTFVVLAIILCFQTEPVMASLVDASSSTAGAMKASVDMFHAMGLSCRCDSYDCQCKKECMCKVVQQPGRSSLIQQSDTVFMEESTTIKESDPASTESTPAASTEVPPQTFTEAAANVAGTLPSRTAVEPALFKCGCDFGGADVQVGGTSGLECDCSSAKCMCTKKCVCQDGNGGRLSFLEEHADVAGINAGASNQPQQQQQSPPQP